MITSPEVGQLVESNSLARTMETVGGDGFAIRQGLWPGYVTPFVEKVIPLLRQRGVVRTEYTWRPCCVSTCRNFSVECTPLTDLI